MKKTLNSSISAFLTPRTLIGLSVFACGFVLSLYASGVLPTGGAKNASTSTPSLATTGFAQARPGTQRPDIVQMVGPVHQDQDLRFLPYHAPSGEHEVAPLSRHPYPIAGLTAAQSASQMAKTRVNSSNMAARIVQQAMTLSAPSPMLTFDAIDSNMSGCGCLPPDSEGDVGPNHYMASMNSSIAIYDKNGNMLAGPITYNSFFAALGTSTTCGNNLNDGDGIIMYDHLANRWMVSDFAFNGSSTAGPYYQCIGVSKTADPVSGGWYLYTQQIDPANVKFLGDYPKFGVWPDAYYMSVNLFDLSQPAATQFQGVRVFAFNRPNMVNGGSANTVSFFIAPANLGDQYSLVPATFRAGGAPPVNQPEWFMDVNSSSTAGTVETQIFVRRFHVDFVTPSNSTFGTDPTTHAPDGTITVNGFVDAETTAGTQIVPNGTATTTQFIDTLGDKIMWPMVYQNINGKEYIYADQTILLNYPNGPSAVRWYQLDMTGNTIPASPTQQQDFNNGSDGLWRFMPSINVDGTGNMAIGYSVASTTLNPGIRYAGRLYADNTSTLTQTEAIMTAATGHQTRTNTDGGGRWGDYSALFVDPNDNCTFWHTNEYYSVNGQVNWRNRVGLFKLAQCTGSPLTTPTPTPSPAPTVPPTPAPTPTATATPSTSPTPSPTPPVSAGNVTVVATAGTTGPTGYATVQAAFAAINAGIHQGAVTVWIMADTAETGSALLNAPVAPASYTSVLVLPNGTRNVSGNIASDGLIKLDGAKNVRIDGYNQLTLANTNTGSTANTSTIRFLSSVAANGGAQNDTVANASIQGSSTVAIGTAGGNVLIHNTVANGTNIVGNNNIVIANNDIGPAGGVSPTKCVSMVGTTTNANVINTGDVITNNNIHDFFNATANTTGIDIRTGNTSFVVSSNRIFQTATRTFTGAAGLRYSGIVYSGSTGAGATGNWGYIYNNVIGFGAANGTGTTTITGTGTGAQNEVRGIDVNGTSSGTATEIYGNIVSGMNQTSGRVATTTCNAAFAGISACAAGAATSTAATGTLDIGTVAGNTIGSLDGSTTIVINATSTTASTTPIFGILGLTGSTNSINNNRLGAITVQGAGTVTGIRGIFPGATAATTQYVNNNQIGGASAGGAITVTQLGNYAIYGIQASTAAVSIYGNTIQNLVGNANVAGTVVSSGIVVSSTSTLAVSTISQNKIFNLTNNSGTASTSIYGMDLTMTTNALANANLIERNLIHSFTNTSTDTTSQLYGMIIRGANTTGTITNTVQNNVIRLGLDASGASITNGLLIRGIRDAAAGAGGNTNNSFYYNSVYIGGSNVASASNTQCFFSDQVTSATSPRNIRNNIFYNARSNSSGAGKNYAIGVAGTAPNPTGLVSNNNDLYANGTGGFVGLYNSVDQTTLANWQAATGVDANSISADPLFVNPTGTAATVDLHISAGSPAIGAGIPVTATIASPLVGILNDLDGYSRNATTPTIGAYEFAAAPALSTVVSRLVHGGAGTFDLPLSTSSRVVEPRADGSGNFTVVFNYNAPVTTGTATVTSGTGTVSNVTYSGNSMIVSLSGVTDQQTLTLTTSNVGTTYSTLSANSVQIGFLNGDVTGDGVVNIGDTIVVRNNAGAVTAGNFTSDVNIDGAINVGDTAIVRMDSGHFLP